MLLFIVASINICKCLNNRMRTKTISSEGLKPYQVKLLTYVKYLTNSCKSVSSQDFEANQAMSTSRTSQILTSVSFLGPQSCNS